MDFTQRKQMNNEHRRPYEPRQLDLNCDLGQKWGVFSHREEEQLLPYVSSVNIACGGHAGDPVNIMHALSAAKAQGVAVGAHIGYPDQLGFGRKEIRLDQDELAAYVIAQLGTLAGMAKSFGITLTHFRPHGAMYQKCGSDPLFAENLAKIAASFSSWLVFVAPAGNYLNAVSESSSLKTAGEVHLDKFYRRDGFINKQSLGRNISYEFAISQAKSLIMSSRLIADGGMRVRVPFKTIHLNLDRPYSVQLAEDVNNLLKKGPASFEESAKIGNIQISDIQADFKLSGYVN
jgi:UPF0271 protein